MKMKRISLFTAVVVSAFGVALIGCGDSQVAESDSAPAPAASTENGDSAETPENQFPVTPKSSPEEVVKAFLNSIRQSDVEVARLLLTETARIETAKIGLVPDVMGAPNSTYEILGSRELSQDGAHVSTKWTESSVEGENTFEINWVMRKGDEGWRVSGMATQLNPEDQPVFLNFENPDEMLSMLEQAHSDLADHPREPVAGTQVSTNE